MRRTYFVAIAVVLGLACLTSCSGQGGASTPGAGTVDTPSTSPNQVTQGVGQEENSDANPSAPVQSPSGSDGGQQGGLSGEEALAIAQANAGVPAEDCYNVKIERDGDNGIPIYDIEFETDYGDYDFEIAIDGGRIVGADYEVDEAWLDTLGGSKITLDEAKWVVQEKVPGSPIEDIQLWEETDDGRGRYEGELFYDGMKYEFEIDPSTGRIFDWNADLRG